MNYVFLFASRRSKLRVDEEDIKNNSSNKYERPCKKLSFLLIKGDAMYYGKGSC